MNKVTKIGIVCGIAGLLLTLAGCGSKTSTETTSSPSSSSSTLAGSKASPDNPGRVSAQGPRGAGG